MEKLLTIGIDFHQILLYVVNFGVVWFVLAKYMLPPIQNAIANRKKNIDDNLEKAMTLQTEMEQLKNKTQSEQKVSGEAMKLQKNELEKSYREKQESLVENMEKEKNAMIQETMTMLNKKKEEIVLDAQKDILVLIQKVVSDVLSNAVPAEAIQKSVADSWKSQQS
jgi:F-type H+-transporting ATPase subunit b